MDLCRHFFDIVFPMTSNMSDFFLFFMVVLSSVSFGDVDVDEYRNTFAMCILCYTKHYNTHFHLLSSQFYQKTTSKVEDTTSFYIIYTHTYIYIYVYIYMYIPRAPITSIFEGHPSKARPNFQPKQGSFGFQ